MVPTIKVHLLGMQLKSPIGLGTLKVLSFFPSITSQGNPPLS